MISIAKNAKNSTRHWVWHSKTQDIYTFIHRATFIHKFICDFLMVASTYKCKISPGHWVWHHWQDFSLKIGNRMLKFMKMRGTYV